MSSSHNEQESFAEPSPELKEYLLANNFEYIRQIGNGASSNCFLLRSIFYDDYFVVKENLNERKLTKKYRNRELEILSKLSHPNIIKLYSQFVAGENLCLVLEYCSNGSLVDYVKKYKKVQGSLLYEWSRQLLIALQYTHDQKIAHRDIKPANIFIDQHSNLKLADFGLSDHFTHDQNVHYQNFDNKNFVGSKLFMSPELINQNDLNPFISDVWSLGVTFYYMATRRYPFPKNNGLRESISLGAYSPINDIKDEYAQVIASMLEIIPEDRVTISTLLQNPIFSKTHVSQSVFLNPTHNSKSVLFHSSITPRLWKSAQKSCTPLLKSSSSCESISLFLK